MFLEPSEIWAFEAADRLTFVHTAHGKFDLDLSLAAIEASFGRALMRVHRNWLVNMAHIKELERDGAETRLFVGAGLGEASQGVQGPGVAGPGAGAAGDAARERDRSSTRLVSAPGVVTTHIPFDGLVFWSRFATRIVRSWGEESQPNENGSDVLLQGARRRGRGRRPSRAARG